MMDVGKTTWEEGYKKGFKEGIWKAKLKRAISSLKALMKNGYTIDEALDLLEIDGKIAKIARKKLA